MGHLECLSIWLGSGMSQKCLINIDLHFEELVLFLECWGIEELICPYETGELLMFLLLSQLLGEKRINHLIAQCNQYRLPRLDGLIFGRQLGERYRIPISLSWCH